MATFSYPILFMFFFYVLLALFAVSNFSIAQGVAGQVAPRDGGDGRRELVLAMFVFGDSLIDNGNNNNLPSFAKANYYPYGIDFVGRPTERFSNGYTIVDKIADLLRLPLIPPYSQASSRGLLHGVNYALAAVGILDITGCNFVGRIPFNQQISNFKSTLDQITRHLGPRRVANDIGYCIFFVGIGRNDSKYLRNG